ncbi:acetyl-CoA carboxylase biotin carboxylase subunit family protein [Bradyrhizobium sp. ISRA443]|uniref:ATP-grasp domain-containing protein n=1 Tax=unclassified Bradyrhizobium TaxID=2631580 RepID=UPI002479FF93|nr:MULTISPECIES: acetyl-CoA carboxylase biotin carboxylase subunit family protein [unclassified Bradyrhizobium]WGR97940.1 acetyl-CoA carboxylase biotin carboxylase subunit family protein [Bradyrhizobium sp. ISRA436]WGS04830.1 acetyl-CoA carboxylase biotin carboxylase subunit family protein [Bradyrhizobium sp. ISRA437]WGS11711.1 acetyl-CoA carboxylase biotin carboxylase subunit family protein [Bradyrhizobium sp. ISRA443]
MSRRALILLEGASNGRLYVQTAQRLGLHPITLSADPTRHDYLAAGGCEAIRVDTDNVDAMIHECSRLPPMFDIAGVTSAGESVCAAVGKLCLYFDLPGPPPAAVERCRDKFAQRQLLAEAGVPVPAYRLAVNPTDVEKAAAEIGLPVIVKPAAGSGSSGVRLCRDVDELAEHSAYLLGEKYIWRSSPRILVEEFAQGPHYSVEMMGNEVIAIGTADFGGPPHFVCREYIYPALLSDDEHRGIADVSLSALQALGLAWGPTNVDVRWTTLGPVVIEVNPRLAGTPNPQLVKLAYGVDLITEHIKLVIGEKCNLRRSHPHSAGAKILVPDRDGILDAIGGESQAAAVPGVTEVKFSIEPNTPIVRKGDYRDRIGHVIAASPNLAQTKAILQHAVHFIDWSITPFPTQGEQKQRLQPRTARTDADDVR